MTRKKLIEVALPLEDINREACRDKSLRHGHPSTLHYWWARRPLAACRAVLFASLVDDPSSYPDRFPTEEAQEAERKRLFQIIRDLIKWENSNDQGILKSAWEEIRRSTGDNPPPVLDPFCGGGSIPLEAQRLGLQVYASDLNPVAVLITKALVEIPHRFRDFAPVNPDAKRYTSAVSQWNGVKGLASDIRYYGKWVSHEVERRIGHLYPNITVTSDLVTEMPHVLPYVGQDLKVIAWLWARTIQCPNPSCGRRMPLVGSYWLCRKPNKRVWLEPKVDRERSKIRFVPTTGLGNPPDPPKLPGKSTSFRCLYCGAIATAKHLEEQGRKGLFGAELMAIVAQSPKGRIYLPADDYHTEVAKSANPDWTPDIPLPPYSQALPTERYGVHTFADLFTKRQLVMLNTFASVISEAHERILADAIRAGLPEDGKGLEEEGRGARAYADAIVTYLSLALGRQVNRSSAFCFWNAGGEKVEQPFAQQGMNKTWDFAESNPFSDASGSWSTQVEYLVKVVEKLPIHTTRASVTQADARNRGRIGSPALVCCDPPYYSNIGYSDLSDFFYIWHRRILASIHKKLFDTMLTPKAEEIVASLHRFGGDKAKAKKFFLDGLKSAFENFKASGDDRYPVVIFYSFKQQEEESNGDTVSTGWEVMLDSLLSVGFSVTGTWPVRTEMVDALKKNKSSLASSIVLVCRPRSPDAKVISRREFINALKRELPDAIRKLRQGHIAPVDLAQASIGPGMAVFSRYSKVIEADGSPMQVRTALALINQVLDELLSEHDNDYDAATRWAVAWFEQFGMQEGPYGVAETLCTAKNTSVPRLVESGIVSVQRGKVRLLSRQELTEESTRESVRRQSVWEVTQRLIRALETRGEEGAALILKEAGAIGESARDLAYRLYTICDRKGWAQEAVAYNALVVSWPEISRLSANETTLGGSQQGLI